MPGASSIRSPDKRCDRDEERGEAEQEHPDFFVALCPFAARLYFRLIDRGNIQDSRREIGPKGMGPGGCPQKLNWLHFGGVNEILTIAKRI